MHSDPEQLRYPILPRNDVPRTGRALYAWACRARDSDPRRYAGLLAHLVSWGRRNDLPNRFSEWPDDTIPAAYAHGKLYLSAAPPKGGGSGR